MKKFVALLLAAMLVLSSMAVLAEETAEAEETAVVGSVPPPAITVVPVGPVVLVPVEEYAYA